MVTLSTTYSDTLFLLDVKTKFKLLKNTKNALDESPEIRLYRIFRNLKQEFCSEKVILLLN